MPTFDFRCNACNHVFEYTRPFGNTELPTCPECGSRETQKIIVPPAIHFKGTGFYKTDSVPKQPKKTQKTKQTQPEKQEKPAKKPKEEKGT
ncbi:MAG: zinc ribbon domain-containing protein [Candidatus Peribacteraceae bacterium]